MIRKVCLLTALLFLFGCTDPGAGPTDESVDQPPDRREPPASYAESDQIAQSVDAGLCAANLEFAFNSFREIVAGEPADRNVFYSPLSLTIALAMAYNGARGQTAEVMAEAMGIEAMTLEEANQQFSDLMLCLQNCDSALVLNIANSMWVDEAYPVAATFRNNLVYYYFADVFRMLLRSQAAVDSINGWVELHTNGKITEMVDLNSVQNAVLMLIDALYFNAQWTFRFEEDSTKDKPFYPPGGETLTVQMMENSGRDFTYHYDSNFKAVRMPYGRNIAAMYVFLPEYDSNVDDFIAALDTGDWTEWMGSFDSLEAYWGEYAEEHLFDFPRFRMEYEKMLNDVLTALGMGLIFSPASDFTGITGTAEHDPWVEFVKQKAFIEVNEAGTEAAAATIISFEEGMPPSFIVDRPFFFVIRDDRSGSILFMGRIARPEY